MQELSPDVARGDFSHSYGMTDGVLRLTVLSLAGSHEDETPPLGSPESQLYCTCEIRGNPDSRVATAAQPWKAREKGFALQGHCWNADWNATFDMPAYRRDDSLTFAVWAKDQSEDGRSDGLDHLVARTVMTSRTLSALGATPRTPAKGSHQRCTSLDSDLPLAGTSPDTLAFLSIRVSLDLGVERENNNADALKGDILWDTHLPLGSGTDVQDLESQSCGFSSPSHCVSPLRENPQYAFPTLESFTESSRKTLRLELASHSRKLITALKESELRVIKAVNQVVWEAHTAPRRRISVPSIRTSGEGDPAEKFENASMGSSTNTGPPRSFAQQVEDAVKGVGDPVRGVGSVRNERQSAASLGGPKKSLQRGSTTGLTRPARNPKIQNMNDLDSLHTNMIFKSQGLVSGNPPPARPRRPSLQNIFTGGFSRQLTTETKDAESAENSWNVGKDICNRSDACESSHSRHPSNVCHSSHSSYSETVNTEPRSHLSPRRHQSRKSTAESRIALEQSLTSICAEASEATDSPRSRKPKKASGYMSVPGLKISHSQGEFLRQVSDQSQCPSDADSGFTSLGGGTAPREARLAPIASIDSRHGCLAPILPSAAEQPTPKEKFKRVKGKLPFLIALKKGNDDDAETPQVVEPDHSEEGAPSPQYFNSEVSGELSQEAGKSQPSTESQSPSRRTSRGEALDVQADESEVNLPGDVGCMSLLPIEKRSISSTHDPPAPLDYDAYHSEETLDDDKLQVATDADQVNLQKGQSALSPARSLSGDEEEDQDSLGFNEESSSASEEEYDLFAGQTPRGTIRETLVMNGTQSMQLLRRGHEEALLGHASNPAQDFDQLNSPLVVKDSWLPSFMLQLSAITPMENSVADVYFGFVLLLALAASLCSTKLFDDWSPHIGVAPGTLAAGALLGLISIRRNRSMQSLLGPIALPLEQYAIHHNFHAQWMAKSKYGCRMMFLAWAGAVLLYSLLPLVAHHAQCDTGVYHDADSTKWYGVFVHTVAFSYGSGLFLMLLYCQFHIVSFLELMLDSFCRKLFEAEILEEMVSEWNVRQAILRHSARTIENCFVIVQTCALCSLVLAAFNVWSDARKSCGFEWVMLAMEHTPVLIVALVALLLFSKAASVTERCARVPSLVNSINVGNPVDDIRQYVVMYILHSDAGFYVRDVRLTAAMALKITYIFGAAGVGLFMQVLRA